MTINGTFGNDTITPSGPPSPGVTGWYFGLNNNDSILGFAGNDLIDGGIGNDTLDGGIGDDLLYGDAGDDILYGSDGNDILKSGIGNDTLDGGTGNDTLQGGDGNDVFKGGTGNDILYGDAGNDILYGDDGNDTLYGGLGRDTLTGGNGNDSFRFGEIGSANADLIRDFSVPADTIILANSLDSTLASSMNPGIKGLYFYGGNVNGNPLNPNYFFKGPGFDGVATGSSVGIYVNTSNGDIWYNDSTAFGSNIIANVGAAASAMTNFDFVYGT